MAEEAALRPVQALRPAVPGEVVVAVEPNPEQAAHLVVAAAVPVVLRPAVAAEAAVAEPSPAVVVARAEQQAVLRPAWPSWAH